MYKWIEISRFARDFHKLVFLRGCSLSVGVAAWYYLTNFREYKGDSTQIHTQKCLNVACTVGGFGDLFCAFKCQLNETLTVGEWQWIYHNDVLIDHFSLSRRRFYSSTYLLLSLRGSVDELSSIFQPKATTSALGKKRPTLLRASYARTGP